MRTPFEGIGKPEALKGDLRGYWSRRITSEHRLVYTFKNDRLYIASCRYHYWYWLTLPKIIPFLKHTSYNLLAKKGFLFEKSYLTPT